MLAQPPKREESAPAGATPTLQLATGFAPRWPGLDGLHEALSYARYHEDPALRHSVLNRIAVSPLYLKTSLEEGDSDTTALTQGRVFHKLVLERGTVDGSVVRVACGNRNANVYKDAVAANPGKDVILQHEWGELAALADRVLSKAIWRDLTRGAKVEASLFWDGGRDMRCKARPDILRLGDGVIADVKTTRDLRYFKGDAEEYGYFRQLAWYAAGAEAVTARRPDQFLLVAVCKRTRDFRVLEVGRKTIEKAHRENLRHLALYEECLRTDTWPGYPQRVEVLVP